MPDNKYNPAYDNKIYQKFSKKTIQNKLKNKEAFLNEVGMPFDKRVPLICITFSLTDENKVNLIQDIMNGILEQPVQVVLTGIGSPKYQEFFTDIVNQNAEKVAITNNTDDNLRKIYAASDITLIPTDSEECKAELEKAMKYGVVPVSPKIDQVDDYNPNLEKGNAFVYPKHSPWSLFASFIRAIENCRFPYDWKNIQGSAMGNDAG